MIAFEATLILHFQLFFSSLCHFSFQIHDDLEKEPEYSGSGFGPDDEDSSSSTHHNKPTSHHTNTNSGGRTLINRKQSPKSEQIIPNNRHDDDDLEIGSGDKVDTDDEDDGNEDIDEGEDVHKTEIGGKKTDSDYDDKDYDVEETNVRSGAFDTNSSPKVTVTKVDDEDDFTTYVKKAEIDSTTTTVTEERQLHGFVFQFIYLQILFDFFHPFIRNELIRCFAYVRIATKRMRAFATCTNFNAQLMLRSWMNEDQMRHLVSMN